MKNLELINLLSLGNVVVAQPYENPDIKFKDLLLKNESSILSKINDVGTRNALIKEFGQSVDSLDSFTYKQFNFIFKLKIFQNQDQKNLFFKNIRENSELYKQFKSQTQTKSRRSRRSLFTERQKLTVEQWIDKLQDTINVLRSSSDKLHGESTTFLATSVGVAASTVLTILSILGGPIGGPIAILIAGGGFVGATWYGYDHYIKKSKSESEKAKQLVKERDSLVEILKDIKTSDDTSLEVEFYSKIEEVVKKVNSVVKDLLNLDSFDFNITTDQVYSYLEEMGY